MKTEEKNTLKILAYLGFFILLFVFLRFESNNNKPVKTEENKNDLSFIDKIEINNYSLQVQAILKDDAVTLLYESLLSIMKSITYWKMKNLLKTLSLLALIMIKLLLH